MKIAIVTAQTRPQLYYVQLSNRSKQQYCDKWGYQFIFHKIQQKPGISPVWAKPDVMLQAMQGQYDYIIWMDADAAIVNKEYDISHIFDEHVIYYSKDVHGLNFGVFAVKCCDTAKSFLQDIVDSYDRFCTARFKQQSAAQHFINTQYKNVSKQIPARVWNSYDNVYGCFIDNIYQAGDFVLHLPNQRRLNKVHDNYRFWRFSQLLQADTANS